MAQRDFYSPFGFGYYDYQVATGHASLYWDTGWYDIETQFSAGRYLAGDWGGTVAVSRRFANGWAVGAYATKTDVTAEDFGEGSFAKGLTLIDPAALVDPVRDAADDQRQPDLAREQRRRVPEHPEPPLPDRARLRPRPPRAELGGVLGMKRFLALAVARGADGLRQRREGPDRPGGGRGVRRLLGARGRSPEDAAAGR